MTNADSTVDLGLPAEPAGEIRDRGQRDRLIAWLPILAAAVLTLTLYAITLGGTHVYDDLFVARDDPRLRHPDRWHHYWTEQYFLDAVDRLYRPLTSMSYALQAYTTGTLAWPFHLVNWLLAGACSAAVAAFVQRLAGWWPAMNAGLIFAAHPIHVEAVAGIVGRAELLCGLAITGGLIIFLKGPLGGRRITTVVACFVIALLSKEQGIVFPLLLGILAALQWFARPADTRSLAPHQRRNAIVLTMATVYITAGYLFFRESILPMAWDPSQLSWSMNPLIHSTGTDRLLMPIVLLGRYTMLLLWPRRLSVDYGAEVIGSSVRWHEPYVYIGAFVSVAAIVLLARAIRRRDVPVAFSILAAGLMYGMVSNLPIIIGVGMAERLMFIPSIFLVLLAGVGLTRLASYSRLCRLVVTAGLPMVLILGCIRTVTYAALWNNPAELFRIGLEEQPRSVQLHRLVFREHDLRGDWVEALKVAESCIKVAPDWWLSYALAARAWIELGEGRKAQEILEYANVRCPHPDLAPEWMRLNMRIEEIHGRPTIPPEEPLEPASTQATQPA